MNKWKQRCQEALCRREDVVNTEESAVQVPDHVDSCDYDAPALHNAGCLKPIQSNISFCGVGVCDDGFQCIVNGSTWIGLAGLRCAHRACPNRGLTMRKAQIIPHSCGKEFCVCVPTHVVMCQRTSCSVCILLHESMPDAIWVPLHSVKHNSTPPEAMRTGFFDCHSLGGVVLSTLQTAHVALSFSCCIEFLKGRSWFSAFENFLTEIRNLYHFKTHTNAVQVIC